MSSLGRVRSWAKRGCATCHASEPRELAAPAGPTGYRNFAVRNRSGGSVKQETLFVHREVARAFHGPPPFDGAVVRHLDGNPLNNRADNLAWGTYKENAADRARHGTENRGERNHWAVLNEHQVRLIRASDKSHRDLAGDFGVSEATVRAIRGRRIWAWL